MRSLTIGFVLLVTSLSAQDAREIINRYLDAVSNGNIDNWYKIKSTYREAEGYYSQQDFEQKVNFFKSPDKINFHKTFTLLPHKEKDELYADSTFTKLLSTFYYLKDKVIILMGNIPPVIKPRLEVPDLYASYAPVKIHKLVERSKSIELLGTKEFPSEGILCYEIKITTKGERYILYINTGTFLLEYWNNNVDGDMSVLTKFDDYKKVEDFLIPMSESLLKNGIPYYWSNCKKYIINSNIDPEIFNYKE